MKKDSSVENLHEFNSILTLQKEKSTRIPEQEKTWLSLVSLAH